MQSRHLGILAVLVITGAAAPPALAGSWTQRFEEAVPGGFDFIAVEMTSPGDVFESPTFRNFDDTSWDFGREDDSAFPTTAFASGDEVETLRFDIAFESPRVEPFEFDFFSYLGDDLRNAATASWDGTRFSIANYEGGVGFAGDVPERTHFAPAPTALPAGLAMFGVLAAGWRRRRFRTATDRPRMAA